MLLSYLDRVETRRTEN